MKFKAVAVTFILLFSSLALAKHPRSGHAHSHQADASTHEIESRLEQASRFLNKIYPFFSLMSASYNGADAPDFKSKTGWAVGCVTEMGAEPWTVEFGLMFRQVGATLRDEWSGNDVKDTLNVSYIGAPVSGKFYFSRSPAMRLFAKVGIIPAITVAKSESGKPADYPTVTDREGYNFLDNIQPSTMELSSGIGGKVKVAKDTELTLDLAYTQGLIPVIPQEAVYNSALVFTTGVGINL